MSDESEDQIDLDTNDEDEHQDSQMAFVVLLADFKVLFDKRQTPTIKKEKELAAKELALVYSRNMNKDVTTKQVMKKFNNMKTKVKAAADRKRTGNKKIRLTEWHKKILSLWDNESGNNPVLQKVPGATSAGTGLCVSQSQPSVQIGAKKKTLPDEDEPAEFRNKSMQQLQRQCLINQIKAARAQEAAAKAMLAYYQQQSSQYIVVTDTEEMQ